MPSRFGRGTPGPSRSATAGAVLDAVEADAWARERLAAVYRQLFENGGARRGPDHFVYVQPSRARCEIRELSSWVHERFGSPGSRVPRTTPFGYLSGRWDGWITYFTALSAGSDDDLRKNFRDAVAELSWSAAGARPARSREVHLLASTSTVPREASEARPSISAPERARGAVAVEAADAAVAEAKREAELERRDLEEEQRRREEKREHEIEELRARNEWLRGQIEAERARPKREMHASVREGRTGEKMYRGEAAAEHAREIEPTPREEPRTPRSSPALL